jgi:NTE family protein
VLAEGYLEGGREGARKCLAKFWRSIGDAGAFSSAARSHDPEILRQLARA